MLKTSDHPQPEVQLSSFSFCCLSFAAIPSRNSFTQQMRRNALKNRKLSQTKKWRIEKHRLSGKHPLKSSTLQQLRTLVSQVTRRDVRVRVRRHSVDFLLSCKDPGSKERALLHELEEVTIKETRLSRMNPQSNNTEVNLRPFTLNSPTSAQQTSKPAANGPGVNGKAVKVVDRQPVRTRTSLRTRSRTTLAQETGPTNTADATTVCHPVENDKTCSAIREEKAETGKAITEDQSNKCSDVKSPAAEPTLHKTTGPASPIPVSETVTGCSRKDGDNPLISLKQYLRVSLTRLSVPQSLEVEKVNKGRGRKSQDPKPAPQTARRSSRCQLRPGRASESCTAEGNRGVREMFFKATDKVNLRKSHTGKTAGDLSHSENRESDKVIEIQTVSEKEACVQAEQQDTAKGKNEEGEEKINAAAIVIECKSNTALEEAKELQSKMVSGEKAAEENNTQCGGDAVKGACKEEAVVKGAEQTVTSVNKEPVSRHSEDIVIKQAKVLLSDILRKDKPLIGKRLQEDDVGGGCPTSAEMCSGEEKAEQAEINTGTCHQSAQKGVTRRRKPRPRAAKTKVDDKQSIKGNVEEEVAATVRTEVSEENLQPQSAQKQNDPPATCHSPLPHKPLVSTKAMSKVHPDTNTQAHTQSNIPLKKRTFRSSVEIDSKQASNSASDPVSTEVTEFSSSAVQKQDIDACSEESSKQKREGKVRFRPTELQKLVPKRIIKHNFLSRVLRPRANDFHRASLSRKARRRRIDRQPEQVNKKAKPPESDELAEDKQAEDPIVVQEQSDNNPIPNKSEQKEEVETLEQQNDLEETKPELNFKILFKRKRGREWEMKSPGLEDVPLKSETVDGVCDPFKAIMDSVSILNMEMEAAQAHVQASKKSKSRLHRLKKRGERRYGRQSLYVTSHTKSEEDQDCNDVKNPSEPNESTSEKVEIKQKLEEEPLVEVKPSLEKMECQKDDRKPLSPVEQETKIEDHLLNNCCLFESALWQKQEVELDSNGFPLPVIKLRRKAEDIWEVDSKDDLMETELKLEPIVKKEMKCHALEKYCMELNKLKEECPSSQRLNNNAAPLKTELPPFSLSLSPLSLSSPLNDNKNEIISSAAEKITERPEMNSGGRIQRHKMERLRKCGPVETPTPCLSHTLQQIDNSLSRLSEGLCSSQTLEKPTTSSSASNSVIQPPSQFLPFTTTDNMLSGEPSFTNCCDDILDFQCLNFEGYYQPQNILPSSPSDLCSLDPPTDPFSSPLSHSPADTWATETPYLGPPSPGNNFTSEDLQFFPGLISSKSDSAPLECEVKDTSKDRNTPNTSYSFSTLSNTDFTAKDRNMSKNPGVRVFREDFRTQSGSVIGKPRLFGTLSSSSSVTAQSSVPLTQPSITTKPSTSQIKAQPNMKSQVPFHRMSIPSKSQPFLINSHPNAVRGLSQSSLTKSVPSSQMPNKFPSPQLFTVKNPNPPPDSPLNFNEKTSTVIHRVLKYQGGSQTPNLYSAPCKITMAADGPTIMPRTLGTKPGATEKIQQSPKVNMDSHIKGNMSVQGFGKVVNHHDSTNNPNRSSPHFNKLNFPQTFCKNKMSSDKHESGENNMTYKNFSALPRPFFFPTKMSDGYSSPEDRNMKRDKPAPSTTDKHQPCYAQQDPFDFNFGSSLSPISQHNSPQVAHSTPPGTPAPANKSQSSSASFTYGCQGPPYILNFTGDHSLTLGLRDGAEGYTGLSSANYTYHCLMEPSGTQGRLVLEPCGPQHPNQSSFSLGGFSGMRGQDEHCRKDMQQQCQSGDHTGTVHYGPVPTSHSMGPGKPKRVRLVVTDGTVDLDLQYAD